MRAARLGLDLTRVRYEKLGLACPMGRLDETFLAWPKPNLARKGQGDIIFPCCFPSLNNCFFRVVSLTKFVENTCNICMSK
jgi:hypothetical protein